MRTTKLPGPLEAKFPPFKPITGEVRGEIFENLQPGSPNGHRDPIAISLHSSSTVFLDEFTYSLRDLGVRHQQLVPTGNDPEPRIDAEGNFVTSDLNNTYRQPAPASTLYQMATAMMECQVRNPVSGHLEPPDSATQSALTAIAARLTWIGANKR